MVTRSTFYPFNAEFFEVMDLWYQLEFLVNNSAIFCV